MNGNPVMLTVELDYAREVGPAVLAVRSVAEGVVVQMMLQPHCQGVVTVHLLGDVARDLIRKLQAAAPARS